MSEELELLRSIDASLKALLAASKAQPIASIGGITKIASDADLDGKYGDPEIKAKSPRDWTGPDMTGKRFSECPAAYLDLLAERLDYFAEKNAASGDEENVKKARYQRLDAGRARGWAARVRAGKVQPADPDAGSDSNDSVPW